MTTEALLEALVRLRVEPGSLACLGCGHEHHCSVPGCQILREAAAQLEHFTAENRALRAASRPKKVPRSQKQNYDASVTYLREMVKELNAQREKTETERDALLTLAKNAHECAECKNCNSCERLGELEGLCGLCGSATKCPCYGCRGERWEWRGLPEAPGEGEKA